jgi:hypothetical protein
MGMTFAVSSARADIPAPGYCDQSMVGSPCEFAVDKNGKEVGPGVCVAEMCTRATPDGPMQYACAMCRPKEEPIGTAGAGSGGEGGADPIGPIGGTGGDPIKPPMPVAGSETGGSSNSGGSHNGTAGAPISTAGAPVTNAGAANKGDANSDDAGGCSVAHGARGTAVTLAGLGLALGLVLRRRGSSHPARG